MSLPVVAVVDTGVDDALALVVAARHPALDLRGVVCAAGNVPLKRVLANTHHVLGLLGARVPVAAGAARKLNGLRFAGRSVHGPDGLAGFGPRADPAAPGHLAVTAAELVRADAVPVCPRPPTPLPAPPAGGVAASPPHPGAAHYEMDPVAAASLARATPASSARPRSTASTVQPLPPRLSVGVAASPHGRSFLIRAPLLENVRRGASVSRHG